MRGVTVARLDDDASALAAWRAFVAEHAGATFFHRPEWLTLIRRCYGYAPHGLIAYEGGAIAGVLPLVDVKTPLFGRSLISTAFTVGGGIAAETEAARSALAAAAARLGEDLGVDYVELRGATAAVPGWPVKDDVYAGFRRALAPDPDARLKAIPRKKRADVRKAVAAAPPVDPCADLETFYRLYAHSLRGLGTPVPGRRWFRALVEAFGDAVEISAVRGPGGDAVAALLTFYHQNAVLPYYAGAGLEARRLRAYDAMYWSLMGRAVERGAAVFDFGRSKYGTGAFDYKTHWGFEPAPLAYQYRLVRAPEVPNVNPNNPKYARFARLWRRLPLAAATRLGPMIARQLG